MSIEGDLKLLGNFRYDARNIFESHPLELISASDQVFMTSSASFKYLRH